MMLEIIKDLCNSRGLSINKLEQELGFSQGSIGKMGDSIPKADRLRKIADYFGLPMEYFFEPSTHLYLYVSICKGYKVMRCLNPLWQNGHEMCHNFSV